MFLFIDVSESVPQAVMEDSVRRNVGVRMEGYVLIKTEHVNVDRASSGICARIEVKSPHYQYHITTATHYCSHYLITTSPHSLSLLL